jgi:hypothetical protein
MPAKKNPRRKGLTPIWLGEEGNNARTQFPQVARKFISPCQLLEFAAAGENIEAELGKGVQELVEPCADKGRGLLGVEAGTGIERGKQRADGKLDLLLRQPPGVIGKGRDVIELGEEHVDGQRDAERLGELAEALVEGLRQGANLLGSGGGQDALDADADHHGTRRQAAVS